MNKRISAIKNTVWNGIAIGFITPIVPGVLVWYLMRHITALRHADLLLIGCVAINAFLMNYFFKLNKENIGRGILSITFLWAFAFFFYKV
ncbi:stationary phase survival protein SurE [Pedobacter sp. UC225_61]|uniref:stationary phase survival protein SurE n=1 Tax=Pedobacter sp. UC225_61 TaxID=3374623 RepID=UPI0037944A33